jgi:hypothetical protein
MSAALLTDFDPQELYVDHGMTRTAMQLPIAVTNLSAATGQTTAS